ncbi:hypothetical protein [Halobacterium zhouii]|uniref:hypothetical protein n=1 Tax=Halobacterium zhouii TaxID=2902624 RepID=UPI001E299E02|nr:hypothetical protein [Halobacterium zhouii]
MQRKPVPPAPESLDAVDSVRAALPLVPQPEDDCCQRVVSRAGVPDRGTASAWLVFLAAVGLASETDGSYARTTENPDRDALADAFESNVFLASETVEALSDDPQSPADVFEQVRERVPRWERAKRDNWEAFWTERVERRLDWAVLFGLAERTENGFVAAD